MRGGEPKSEQKVGNKLCKGKAYCMSDLQIQVGHTAGDCHDGGFVLSWMLPHVEHV